MRNADAIFKSPRPNLGLGVSSALLNNSPSPRPLAPAPATQPSFGSQYGAGSASSTPGSSYSAYDPVRMQFTTASPSPALPPMHQWNTQAQTQPLHPAIRTDYTPRPTVQQVHQPLTMIHHQTPPAQKKPPAKVQYKVLQFRIPLTPDNFHGKLIAKTKIPEKQTPVPLPPQYRAAAAAAKVKTPTGGTPAPATSSAPTTPGSEVASKTLGTPTTDGTHAAPTMAANSPVRDSLTGAPGLTPNAWASSSPPLPPPASHPAINSLVVAAQAARPMPPAPVRTSHTPIPIPQPWIVSGMQAAAPAPTQAPTSMHATPTAAAQTYTQTQQLPLPEPLSAALPAAATAAQLYSMPMPPTLPARKIDEIPRLPDVPAESMMLVERLIANLRRASGTLQERAS